MTLKLTNYGFKATWQDSDGLWHETLVDLRENTFHPWMWETNAAVEEGL